MKLGQAHIIKGKVALGETKEAISMLVSESRKYDEVFQNECTLLSSRFYRLLRGVRLKILEEPEIKFNQISLSVLQLVDECSLKKKQ